MLNGDWSLPNLKTLVYQCHFPRNEILRRLIMNCPNIQELHIGNKKADLQAQYYDRPVIGNVDFLSTIQFQNLRFLTLDGFPVFDGSFLLPIVKQCRKLEKLYISGLFEAGTYLSNLGESLPLAANLRDLRLEWRNVEKYSDIVAFLKNLLKCASHLKRLVLIDRPSDDSQRENVSPSSEMKNSLFSFVSGMENLVALCFTSYRIHSDVFNRVTGRVVEEVVPLRPPSFWFHLCQTLPKENDPSVPRIHSDEIVHPMEWFDTSPKFNH